MPIKRVTGVFRLVQFLFVVVEMVLVFFLYQGKGRKVLENLDHLLSFLVLLEEWGGFQILFLTGTCIFLF